MTCVSMLLHYPTYCITNFILFDYLLYLTWELSIVYNMKTRNHKPKRNNDIKSKQNYREYIHALLNLTRLSMDFTIWLIFNVNSDLICFSFHWEKALYSTQNSRKSYYGFFKKECVRLTFSYMYRYVSMCIQQIQLTTCKSSRMIYK